MATILMAWELGEGLGHLKPLLRVARPLADEGHHIIFAVADLADAWILLQNERFPFLQAPLCIRRDLSRDGAFLAASLADILAMRGWGSSATLRPLVEAWQALLDRVSPDLIVTHYAPTLCLTAFGKCPLVQIGTWFEMAPVHAPEFPALAPSAKPTMTQADLYALVADLQRARGAPVPTSLTAVLAAGDRFPMTFPELDPYHAIRSEQVWDPVDPLPAVGAEVPVPRFFAYLNAANRHVEPYLIQFGLTGTPGEVFLRNASPELKDRLRLQGLTVHDRPASLDEVLARSSVVIHHGGSLASEVFAAGRPQLLIPQHLEQRTTSEQLARLGVARVLLGNASPDSAGRVLRQMMTERKFTEAALAHARQIHGRPPRSALPVILQTCRRRLAR